MRDLPRKLSAAELAELFEGETALVRRLAELDDPLARAPEAISGMSEAEKLEALDAHPAIGGVGISARSAAEQGTDDDPDVLAELARLNREYEARHGFRFVVFVDGRPKREVLRVLRARLPRSREEELETALGELVAIARDRWRRDQRDRLEGGGSVEEPWVPPREEARMRIHYGKAEVSVYRSDGVRALWGAEVEIDVFGDNFAPAYTAGDNSMVVATDTMKNFVHVAALEFGGDSLEAFGEHLGRRFLETYGHVERIGLRLVELPFARRSDVLFQRLHDDRSVVELSLDRGGVTEHRCGREGLELIKTTGSAFASFARDSYTTLPEVRDRPLFVHLDVHWRYADWEQRVRADDVRDSIAATFDDFVSMSIQHLVHEMGTRALRQFPELSEIAFEARNRLWDTALVSEADERVKVYTDPRPPYGMIGLVLRRDDLAS